MVSVETVLISLLIIGGIAYGATCLAALAGTLATHQGTGDSFPRVSVIIPARNEEKTIGRLLGDLVKQDYPADRLKIVVVDDCSEDGTARTVMSVAADDDRITLVTTESSAVPYRYKKRAIQTGIDASMGELIMTVDADCRIGPSWVRSKAAAFSPDTDLVAGEVSIEGGGILGAFEALEMAGIQAMSAGLMNIGFPVTCNGANLAYRRAAFERVGGFEDVGQYVSGDDDLLMQKIARDNPRRVRYVTGRETAVHTEAVKNMNEFLTRRTRWASKIGGYPSRAAVGLLTLFFFYFTAILLWIPGMVYAGYGTWPLLGGFGVKIAGDFTLTMRGLVGVGRPGLIALLPFAELLHIPYLIAVTVRGTFGTFEWRGRHLSAVPQEEGDPVHE